ncbi:tellurium resistance protein TerD [Sediminihabitans luteus]|uniref:Tellurium resistance protein TerD n=1 Tax=Sediminihabitans luteus TaxID=1138585 RepID=A0A2M9CC22_9CELL|nr:TerD family protein [Sediminihabitans luteus]PJJ68586.1 tellurium resistance protein TerD [Sediminihabitans luteus]GII99924.1 chemical-damaging agent resistance protein C [Sediminihabitans luteus]
MAVNLSKGGNISLTKVAPGLVHAGVGLGWDPRTTDGAPFDLDASAILLDASGKALSDHHFVFYNNLVDPSGAVEHQGDNTTGVGDGDDETITVDLSLVPAEVMRIVVLASIHDADNRRQNFGQVADAYIRVYDLDDAHNDAKVVKFDLGEDASTETALVFGEIYRNGTDWKFRAIGQGYASGLAGVISDYGLNAG